MKKELLLKPINGNIQLDILSNLGSIEMFANGGEISAAFYYLPEERTGRLKTFALKGDVKINRLVINEVKPFWK